MRVHRAPLRDPVFTGASSAELTPPLLPFPTFFESAGGWGDLGANGFGAETPNLDALAAGGIRFTDMHSNSVCTPSRAAMQTGRYNIRMQIDGNFDVDSKAGLALGELTIADILKRAPTPYSTRILGKWHLGVQPKYHPTWRGYDNYMGVPYSIDMGCQNSALNASGLPKPPGCSTTKNASSPAIPLYNASLDCSGISCNSEIVQQPADLTLLDNFYAQAADEFISMHASGAPLHGTPFFMYVPFSHVHVPLSHNPRFRNASKRNNLFADTLLEMDDTVGRIVGSLRTHALDEDTLILVVGDNGPWNAYCDDAGSQGFFTGSWQLANGGGATGKFTEWEGGHREASLAYWPKGIVQPGRTSNATLHIVDFLVTLASLAGVPLPTDRHYDGVDFSSVLTSITGPSPSENRYLAHQGSGGTTHAMRYKNYKAHWITSGAAACDGKGGPTVQHSPPLIFDLDADPAEANPITPPAGLVDQFNNALAALLNDVSNSFATKSNYSSGGRAFWPCCNPDTPACQCEI